MERQVIKYNLSANTVQTLLTWLIGADETPHLSSDIWNHPSIRDVLRTVVLGAFHLVIQVDTNIVLSFLAFNK